MLPQTLYRPVKTFFERNGGLPSKHGFCFFDRGKEAHVLAWTIRDPAKVRRSTPDNRNHLREPAETGSVQEIQASSKDR
jgi:hypothetical protein